ncbi:MAG: glycosyltransferase [Flavobacteriia bacterium]|jgi:glycosyltransferase involved in cell wall biosynthesis
MTKKQIILVSVTNDLVTDQRVHKVCMFLHENNFDVTLIGRKLIDSQDLNRVYKTKRFNLLVNKGKLFYAFYNWRLFWYLLFHKTDVLLSNDLDTLLPNYLVSKIKRIKLVYDSHEYFTEVPELVNRPKVQKFWLSMEKRIFPKLKNVYTVNESLAKIYQLKYHVPVKYVMNVPNYEENEIIQKNEIFTVIYQGALNKDRGLEELISAFQFLENIQLWIAGEGDLSNQLRKLTQELNLENKITFLGKIPLEKLKSYTQKGHLGVSLEKGTNLNYQVATPNKVFDYVAAGLPVLTCELLEIKKIVESYKIGFTIPHVEGNLIAEKIQWMTENPQELMRFEENCKIAAKELCWENQLNVLKEFFLP